MYGLRQLVNDKSVASLQQICLQVDFQNLLSTGFLQIVLILCNKSANDKLGQA